MLNKDKHCEILALCFTEHHLKELEIQQVNIEGYKLCTAYSRTVSKMGGVSIFIKKKY